MERYNLKNIKTIERLKVEKFIKGLTDETKTWTGRLRELDKMEKGFALIDKKIIGIVYYSPCGNNFEMGIVVDKKYHGQGIGYKLLVKIEKLAKKNRIDKLIAKVYSINKPMIHLIEKLNWAILFKSEEFRYYAKIIKQDE